MKRRQFITVLGGAAAGFPLAAGTQQPDWVRRIGVLIFYADTDPEAQTRVAAFREQLQKLGYEWTQFSAAYRKRRDRFCDREATPRAFLEEASDGP